MPDVPDLQPWHTIMLAEKYRVTSTDSNLSLKEFLEREDRLFESLDRNIYSKSRTNVKVSLSRYVKGSRAHPGRFTRNWNRSYELIPDEPKGGVVLLHGLTDSPYSMRAIAEIFHSQGLLEAFSRGRATNLIGMTGQDLYLFSMG